MDVFVLMEDGGYDGDVLLGVFSTEEKAQEAADAWRGGDGAYVCRIAIDSDAEVHPSEASIVS